MKRKLVWICLLGGGTAMALALPIQSMDWLGSNRVRLACGSASGAGTVVQVNSNLQGQFANWAVVSEHLHGIDGKQEDGARCELRCLHPSDSPVARVRERFGFGNQALLEDRLIVLTIQGSPGRVDLP